MHSRNKSVLRALSALISSALLLLFAMSANAAQTSSNIDIRATVAATCRINTIQDIDFGSLISATNTEYDTRGRINYACTNGIRGRFSLDGGTTTGNVLDRAMQAPDGSQLKYQLYTNRRYVRIWGDGSGASRRVRSGLGRGIDRPRNRNIFARLLDADLSNVNPGNYTDVITLSFDF